MFFKKQKFKKSNLISKSFWGTLAFLLCFGFLVQADDNYIQENGLIENKDETINENEDGNYKKTLNPPLKKGEDKSKKNKQAGEKKIEEETVENKDKRNEEDDEKKKTKEEIEDEGINQCNLKDRPELENVRLNEILADPLEGEEWIELYNSGNKEINLQGCLLADKNYHSKNKYFEFEDLIIKSKNFLVVKKSDFKFTLNNSNEEVYFLDSKVEYGSGKKGFSYSFDGEKWGWTKILTPGKENKNKENNDEDESDQNKDECLIENRTGLEDIHLNEILADPQENEEWIELHNSGNEDVNLSGCFLVDENLYNKGDIEKYSSFKKDFEIEKGAYEIIFNKSKSKITKTFIMNKNNERIYFLNGKGEVLDEIFYKESFPDFSYALNNKNEWEWVENSTPGEKNQFPEPKTYSGKVEMTELMPNPEGNDKNQEWLELFSRDEENIEFEGWYFLNQSDKKFKLDGLKIKLGDRLKVEIKDSSFSLKNSAGWIELRNPNDEIVDRVEYLESAKMNSSYNKKSKNKWEWSIFSTPGNKNRFNNVPTFKVKIPDEIYKDIKTEFEISNAKDKDGEDLKYRWEFSTGKRSYVPITTQTFDKKGSYTVKVRVSDLSVDVFKSFKFKVENFPDFDLEIVKLLPNPAGSDSDNEKIWIKNNEDKRINLKGWIIATGKDSKNLTNHYIKDDFKIKAGDTEDVDREDCAFSLLNKKARIVLKAPNGEIIDKVKYEKEKIEEDEIYFYQNGEWAWFNPNLSEEKVQVLGFKKIEPIKPNFFKIMNKISLDENQRKSNSFQLICFNNWLYSKSEKPFLKVAFPEFLIKKIEI